MRPLILLLTVVILAPSAYAVEPTFTRLTHAEICAALLETSSTTGHAAASLGSAVTYLEYLRGPKVGAPRRASYETVRLTGPRGWYDLFQRNEVHVAVERINQLRADVRDLNLPGAVVGYEFRGTERVRAARDHFVGAANQIHARFQSRVDDFYPPGRLARKFDTAVRLTVPLAFLIPGPMIGMFDPVLGALGTVIGPAAPALAMYVTRGDRNPDHSSPLTKQLKEIDDVLAHPPGGPAFSYFAGGAEVDAELHAALMRPNDELTDEEFDLIVESGQDFARSFFDLTEVADLKEALAEKHLSKAEKLAYRTQAAREWQRRHPDGDERTILWDSIFYVDPKTTEPTWLLFYRGLRLDQMAPPRHPNIRPRDHAPAPTAVPTP